jgi:hypothetical protein
MNAASISCSDFASPFPGLYQDPISSTSSVHGYYKWPSSGGYRLTLVPSDADFMPVQTGDEDEEEQVPIVISSSHSLLKILIALGQAVYAVVTLYNTRGDQITQYGYAAFGLTVAPYAVMSIINLIGNYFCPEYSTLYLVESSVMDEARARGGYFHGVIGRVAEISEPSDLQLTASVDTLQWIELVTFAKDEHFEHGIRATVRFTMAHLRYISSTSNLQSTQSSTIQLQPQDQQNERTIPVYMVNTIADAKDISLLFNAKPQILDNLDYALVVPPFPPLKLVQAEGHKKLHLQITYYRPQLRAPVVRAVKERSIWRLILTLIQNFFPLVVSSIPLAIIGGLTHFQPGSSTLPQRAWIMVWLCLGIFYGYLLGETLSHGVMAEWFRRSLPKIRNRKVQHWLVALSMTYVMSGYGIPAFGAFVMVGQMLMQYGTCVQIP